MSRPIFSRPRTRVYNCNYDKGESYYKPMVDHLDRKYSSRPLFPEPRSSIADEIAARRSDIGSRHLTGTRGDEDYADFLYEGYGRPIPEDDIEDDFVFLQRRFKQRASEAFEEDLAELRRKRRDLQDRLFDMIDVGAEIEKAKSTLENANLAFQKHATKFDNNEEPEIEPENLVARLEKARKLKEMTKQSELAAETDTKSNQKVPLFKWSKFIELENEMPKLVGDLTKARIKGELPQIPQASGIGTDIVKVKPKSERRKNKKKSLSKRRKSSSIES
ncbi:uncharacterized protein [Chelonus insularis]|uniref:uncharacterized protein isoform X2 n=1 Tax=Chelonus insularis TaxID=460826 RepID=UPI00158D8646|nr:uncharacterized protein LOC118074389 isoform X2 [Chelonus insularis]